MNLKQLLLWFVLGFPLHSNACDMCGCFMGITPYDNQSSIQVLHRYRAFNGYYGQNQEHLLFPSDRHFIKPTPNTLSLPVLVNQMRHGGAHGDTSQPEYSNKDYEVYQTTELRVKYFIHNRIELNVFVPVNNFQSLEEGITKYHSTGLGDINVYTGIHIIRKIEVEGLQHRLIFGAGIKLPTGNMNVILNNERIPLMMQSGTGSTDFFVSGNYILGIKKFGMNLTSMFKINGTNRFNEKILPSTAQYLNLFLRINKNNWTFIPAIQNYYEYTNGMLMNNEYMESTKMNVLYSGIGFDFFYKNIGLTTSFQLKIAEETSNGKLAGTSRLALGLTYNFKQKKYLINKSNKES
jgi:hypothetical protein